MQKLLSKFASILILTTLIAVVFAPAFHAQDIGGGVHVAATPDGVFFSVDGQNYNHAMSAIWPAGSKHVLSTVPVQATPQKIQYLFQEWDFNGTKMPPGETVTVTATGGISDYKAVFNAQYGLTLTYFACPNQPSCASSGTIYVNGTAYTSDATLFFSPGATVQLIAVPNAGFVFAGWPAGANQKVQGFVDTVTMTGPIIVSPMFQVARKVSLTTVPDGLNLLADRTTVPTPAPMEWGWSSVHSVGAISPQRDLFGVWWVFQSWSDGGDVNHNYVVPNRSDADTLTATYVRGAVTNLRTNPPNLSLKVDGFANWQSYNFVWGVGEVHHLEAPAQQTDAQGRIWNFTSWSDGGARIHDFTETADALNGNSIITANYAAVGHLTVTSPVSGLSVKVDGADCVTPCDLQRPVGTVLKLSAPGTLPLGDGARMDFQGWPGSGSLAPDWAVTLGPDPVVSDLTYRTMNRLRLSANPPDGANWQMDPPSADGYYEASTTVAVSAAVQPGFRFKNWSGDLSGSAPTGAVQMNAPRAVQAMLDRVPFIPPAGVRNAAGDTPQTAVAPGSVVSIFGASLATDTTMGPDSPLPQTLGGVTVKAGDRLLPLFFVSPTQINVQLPDDAVLGDQSLTVSSVEMPPAQSSYTVARNAPGLFGQTVRGQTFALALHEDGTPVNLDSPAKRGELLTIYGTGFGPTDHPRPTGFAIPDSPAFRIMDTASVQIGDSTSTAENTIAAPGKVGIDAVQFRLGDGAPQGTGAAVFITVNGVKSNTVILPVE